MSAPATPHDQILAEADRIIALGECAERGGRDPINQPTINNWVEAMKIDNPRYHLGEAPPSMAQVWTMYGLGGKAPDDDPLHGMMKVLTDSGFTAVIASNCEQTYERYLRLGEEVRVTTALEGVVGPKTTGLGVGYFVTSRNRWYVDHPDGTRELVATMLFRVLKFTPGGRRCLRCERRTRRCLRCERRTRRCLRCERRTRRCLRCERSEPRRPTLRPRCTSSGRG